MIVLLLPLRLLNLIVVLSIKSNIVAANRCYQVLVGDVAKRLNAGVHVWQQVFDSLIEELLSDIGKRVVRLAALQEGHVRPGVREFEQLVEDEGRDGAPGPGA